MFWFLTWTVCFVIVFTIAQATMIGKGIASYKTVRDMLKNEVDTAVQQGKAVNLPELSEDSMTEFAKACDEASDKLIQACGKLDDATRKCKTGLKLLNIKEEEAEFKSFVPGLENAEILCRALFQQASCHTAIKVLNSKAAQKCTEDACKKANLGSFYFTFSIYLTCIRFPRLWTTLWLPINEIYKKVNTVNIT